MKAAINIHTENIRRRILGNICIDKSSICDSLQVGQPEEHQNHSAIEMPSAFSFSAVGGK
jgi:hypothetical protein